MARWGMSIRIRSPSSTRAMVPPAAASGETWPIDRPEVPPEKLGDPDCAALIQRLNTHSSEFAAGWSAHSVVGFASRRRAFLTPAGKLTFEHHRLAPADLKDIHLVIYTPADDDTPQRLAQLQRQVE
jgi:MmyB-like transcription regulator ligand binding domain